MRNPPGCLPAETPLLTRFPGRDEPPGLLALPAVAGDPRRAPCFSPGLQPLRCGRGTGTLTGLLGPGAPNSGWLGPDPSRARVGRWGGGGRAQVPSTAPQHSQPPPLRPRGNPSPERASNTPRRHSSVCLATVVGMAGGEGWPGRGVASGAAHDQGWQTELWRRQGQEAPLGHPARQHGQRDFCPRQAGIPGLAEQLTVKRWWRRRRRKALVAAVSGNRCFPLVLTEVLGGRHYHRPHFAGGETEAHMGRPCP